REENPEHVGDAHRASSGEAVEDGAADHDGVRAAGEGFQNVRATADSAVHEEGDRAGDLGGDGGQGVDGGRSGVECAAAVVGNDDAGNAVVDGDAGVVR